METVWLFAYGSGKPFAFSPDGDTTWFHERRQALGMDDGKRLVVVVRNPSGVRLVLGQ